jgi:hypothetical protein
VLHGASDDFWIFPGTSRYCHFSKVRDKTIFGGVVMIMASMQKLDETDLFPGRGQRLMLEL